MTFKIEKILFHTIIVLWFCIIGLLTYILIHHKIWQNFTILITFVLFSGALFYFFKNYNRHIHKLKTLENYFRMGGEILASIHEVVVFDHHGQVVYSSYPNLYTNKKDFIRKIFTKLVTNSESKEFIHMLEAGQRGSCLLEGGGNGFSVQSKRWIAYICPVIYQKETDAEFLIVTLTNASHYLDRHSQLKKQTEKLENFLDQAPFGLFYLNPLHHLVGLNETFAQWINLSKTRVLGSVVSEFIAIDDLKTDQVKMITIKPYKMPPFKALLFTLSQGKDHLQPFFLCRIDFNLLLPDDMGHHINLISAFMDAPIPCVIIEPDNTLKSPNKAFLSIIGRIAKKGDTHLYLQDFVQENKFAEILKKLDRARKNSDIYLPFDLHLKNSETTPSALLCPIHDPLIDTPSKRSVVMQLIDTTEQKRLEQQFIQSQKMQAVGQLAGGIAHDFNNLLTAMIGFCDLLLQRYMPNDPSYTDIIQIKQNANRAANLVRQLLAFSRQQNLQPKIINITDILAELSALLRRLIGARIDLIMNHGREIWPVLVDVSQLEQVIINLVVNARDAMDNLPNGDLIIQTSNYHNTIFEQVSHDSMPIGDYVLIEVIDTGQGIAQDIIEHIFEPFFSTKEVGAGTGLGLSTVFGIVKQTGGFIDVESKINKGTKFKIFLPRHTGIETPIMQPVEVSPLDLTGSETILLVEDEDAVRLFSARALRDKGYNVLEAENGDAALALIESGKTFDLLITDVVMPKMDGPTLCQKICEKFPKTKTVFISGYTEDTFRQNLGHNTHIHFLQKPFTLKDLALKVKDVLASDE